MNTIKEVSNIIKKKEGQLQLLSYLQKREDLVSFIHDHNIELDSTSKFTCGVIGCNNRVVAVRLNGVEHRLDVDMPTSEWFARFVS